MAGAEPAGPNRDHDPVFVLQVLLDPVEITLIGLEGDDPAALEIGDRPLLKLGSGPPKQD